ncbi:hypothetical protein CYMTET_14432, partial [Cymbomonas tetramitiformis]
LEAVPSSLLKGCNALQTLSLHGTFVTPDQLEQVEGFSKYNSRRQDKHTKQIQSNVMIGQKGLDDGLDYDKATLSVPSA